MSDGQWRVLGLLALLVFMEAIKEPAVGNFFKNVFFKPFQQAAK